MWKLLTNHILPKCPRCNSIDSTFYNGLPHVVEYDRTKDIAIMQYICRNCDQQYRIKYRAVDIYEVD